MSKPTEQPLWATGATYTLGPDGGSANKIAPTAGEITEGHIRGPTYAPSAQKQNYWQNLVGEWIKFLDEEVPDVQTFEGPTSATWTKPTWARQVDIIVVGGGGGAANAGATNGGGGGGGGGAVAHRSYPASVLGATATCVAGAGGSGNVIVSSHTRGVTGDASSFTSSGILISAGGGLPGWNYLGDALGGTGGAGGTGINATSGGAGGATGPGATGGAGYGGPGGTGGGTGSPGTGGSGYGGGGGGAAGATSAVGGGGGGGSFGGALPAGAQYDGTGLTGGQGRPGVVIVISR